MICAFCSAIEACERHADAPIPVGHCSCDEFKIDVLTVEDPSVLEAEHRPMIGVAETLTWRAFVERHATARVASHCTTHACKQCKQGFGALTLGRWRGNHKKKAKLIYSSGLLIDIDSGGDVDKVADLQSNLALVYSTFSSRPESPRCRLVLPFNVPVPDVETHERLWHIIVAVLQSAGLGISVDVGTKDAGRLAYLPCVTRGFEYSYRAVDGDPLDVAAVLEAQPPEPERVIREYAPNNPDRYVRAALAKAANAVASTSEGTRHYTLSKEAYCLARLALSESEIEEALLPAFVDAAGQNRKHEGERTIRDAIRARCAS